MELSLQIIIVLTKFISSISRFLGLGAGATWPGEIALIFDKNILSKLIAHVKKGIIIVAGTNGKTTTSLMISRILTYKGQKVIHNTSGANLLNGVVSAIISRANWLGKIDADWGVFEVDENSLAAVITNYQLPITNKPIYVVLLNLFRDQLDRYGEVDVIAEKWSKALSELKKNNIKLILNADDPLIAHLGKSVSEENRIYFGIENEKLFATEKEHATDSVYCLNCGGRLEYSGIYFSHLGIWKCASCKEKRPSPKVSDALQTLPGIYNFYNSLAAKSAAQALGFSDSEINKSLDNFQPAFGRQEEFEVDGKKIKIFLSKNPTGFNASLRTVLELKPRVILIVLNDRIPDGRDVSWIWDVDFEKIPDTVKIIVSGDRVYDLALRIKYAQKYQKSNIKYQNYNSKIKNSISHITYHISPNIVLKADLAKAIVNGLTLTKLGETLFILPTYSAMLDVRKILIGRKIL